MRKVTTYKKVVVKLDANGNEHYHPLFVEKEREFEINKRFQANTVDVEKLHGLHFRQIVALKDNEYYPMGALHCCLRKHAPHIKDKTASGEKRVWLKGFTIIDEYECDHEVLNRPKSQGGKWLLCTNFTPTERL